MRPALTDLRVFLHACDGGSMTVAAERAHLTLAAVSARIRALEDRLGAPLLKRHARGATPTPAGLLVARHARAVLHQLEVLERELAGGPAQDGALVLLANSSAMGRPLSRYASALFDMHPQARFALRESGSDVTVHALRSGAADLGIVSDAADTEGLETHDLGPDPLVVALPAGHPLFGAGPRPFAEWLDQAWIGWGETGALQVHLALQALRAGGTMQVRAHVPSFEGVLDLIVRGAGIGVLPSALLALHSGTRRIATLPLQEDWARRRLLLCHRPGPLSPEAATLVRAIANG